MHNTHRNFTEIDDASSMENVMKINYDLFENFNQSPFFYSNTIF